MHAVTWNFKADESQLITDVTVEPKNGIGLDDEYAPNFRGLWDTGATASCVSARLAKQLGLKPVSMRNMQTAGGIRPTPAYQVAVGLPNRVLFDCLTVCQADLGDSFDMLIGMDLIGEGDFAISSFGGQRTMSFRLPSIERIDFVNTAFQNDKLVRAEDASRSSDSKQRRRARQTRQKALNRARRKS